MLIRRHVGVYRLSSILLRSPGLFVRLLFFFDEMLKISDNKLTIKTTKQTVLKLTWDEMESMFLKDNDDALISLNDQKHVPQSLRFFQCSRFTWSEESFSDGSVIVSDKNTPLLDVDVMFDRMVDFYKPATTGTFESLKEKLNHHEKFSRFLTSEIVEYYKSNIQVRLEEHIQKSANKSVVLSKIHGDFTYRNILLLENKDIFLFDFDRSVTSFPEFDYISYVVDRKLRETGEIKYEALFKVILELCILEKPQINGFYERFPNFSTNSEFLDEIYMLFANRLIFFSLLNLRNQSSRAMDLMLLFNKHL